MNDSIEHAPFTTLRRARLDDASALSLICHRCLPRSLRWRLAGAPATTWWRGTLNDPASETWVVTVAQAVAGFVVLVTDESAWRSHRVYRSPRWWRWLTAALWRPSALWEPRPPQPPGRLRLTETAMLPTGETSSRPPHERTWIELIAVDPFAQRQGFASRLIERAIERTRAIGRDAVALRVERDQADAVRCYQTCGFEIIDFDAGDLTLARSVTPEPLRRARAA